MKNFQNSLTYENRNAELNTKFIRSKSKSSSRQMNYTSDQLYLSEAWIKNGGTNDALLTSERAVNIDKLH